MTISLFILIALCGVVIGVLSGMFGIGGGSMMIPLLNLLFRLPILGATATSLFVIAPTSISGAWQHIRQGSIDVRAAMAIGLSGAVASACSSFLSDRLPDIVILVAAICVIVYSAVMIVCEALKQPAGKEKVVPEQLASEKAVAPEQPINEKKNETQIRSGTARRQLIAFICLGLFAGLVAGVVGVGGGFIIVPISIASFGYSFQKASGTSLLAIAFIAVPGIIAHAILGHIWYLGGIALMIGTVPGAGLGARLITMVPERAARFAFGGLLAVAAVMLMVNWVV
jgi:uncharacterized membrane protein YfcA